VKLTEQVAIPPVPASVQLVGANAPFPAVDQVTWPVGVIGVPLSVSVTVTVQDEGDPTKTGVWHATDAAVRRAVPLICVEPALVACRGSPP
jgi:hypothetical protein